MKKRNLDYIFMSLFGIFTMIYAAFNNSPLVERIGEDGGMYLLMGRNLAQGGTLYKDLFDHKGPVIFFLNAIPQIFIKGTLGVWLLELIFLLISMLILYKICVMAGQKKMAVIPPIVYAATMGLLFCGGNYTEEFGNLFVLISLYIFVKWLDKKTVSIRGIITLGICIAIVFFMRPNNIVIIGIIVAQIGIYSLIYNIKSVIKYISFGLAGISVITIPIIIYHYFEGTLYEMFYANVLHNIKYCIKGQSVGSDESVLITPFRAWLIILVFVILYAFIRALIYKDKQNAIFLGTGGVASTISILISGREYLHYVVIILPLFAYAFIVVFKHATPDFKKFMKHKNKINRLIAIILLIILALDYKYISPLKIKNKISKYREDCIELFENIPEDDADNIFGYDVPAMWFYYNDVMPDYKYFTMQSWMSKTNPEIDNDIIEYIKNSKPLWIVTYNENAGNNFGLREIILDEYEIVDNNLSGYLYKHK